LSIFNIINFLILLPITEARSAWIGFFIAIVFLGLLAAIRFKKVRMPIFTVYLLAAITVIIFSKYKDNPISNAIEKIESFYSISYGTGVMRIETYRGAMRGIYSNYWTGIGIGAYQTIDPFYRTPLYMYAGITNNHENTHSEDLQVWEETGTIGIVLYYLFLVSIFIKTMHYFFKLKDNKRCAIILFIIAGQIAVWIQNFVDVGLRFTSGGIIYWFAFAFIAVLIDERNLFATFELTGKNKKIEIKSSNRKMLYMTIIFLFCILFIIQLKTYYGMYYADQEMQKATSYERPDSKFFDAANNEMPLARYGFLIDFYTKAIEYSPYHYEAYYKIAHAYYSLNDFKNAKEYYFKLQKYAPFYANINFNLSLCGYVTKNNPWTLYYMQREIHSNATIENITRYFRNLKEFYPEKDFTSILRSAMWIEDDNPIFQSLLAYEYLSMKKYNLALDQYTMIANKYSEPDKSKHRSGSLRNPVEVSTLKIEALKNAGVICYNFLKKNQLAKFYFEKYIQKTDNIEEREKVKNLIARINIETISEKK